LYKEWLQILELFVTSDLDCDLVFWPLARVGFTALANVVVRIRNDLVPHADDWFQITRVAGSILMNNLVLLLLILQQFLLE
jgi:hypothetical protein